MSPFLQKAGDLMHKIPVHDSLEKVVKVAENQVLSARLQPDPDTVKTALVIIGAFCCTQLNLEPMRITCLHPNDNC
jgi:hypothetical protein